MEPSPPRRNSCVMLTPSLDLQPYIKFFLWIERFEDSPWQGVSRYPSNAGTSLTLTFSGGMANDDGVVKPNAYWFGIPLRPSNWAIDVPYSGLMIFFRSGVAHHLVRESPTEFVYADAAADAVSRRWAAELPERLQGLSPDEVIAAVEKVLRRQLAIALGRRIGPGNATELQLQLVQRPPGAAAAALGISLRQLERRCRRELGVAPKHYHRITRFERLCGTLPMLSRGVSIAEVALAAGFYDQAHMIRDFHDLAGISPGNLLARLSAGDPDYWMYRIPDDLPFQRIDVHR